jgi:hypothetical protein
VSAGEDLFTYEEVLARRITLTSRFTAYSNVPLLIPPHFWTAAGVISGCQEKLAFMLYSGRNWASSLNCFAWSIPSSEMSVRDVRYSSFSQLMTEKSASTLAVPGKRVASAPQKSLFIPDYRTGHSPADSQGIGHLYSKLSFMRRAEF